MLHEILSNPDTVQAAYNIIDASQDVLTDIPYTDIPQILETIAQLNYNVDIPVLSYLKDAFDNLYELCFEEKNPVCLGMGGIIVFFGSLYLSRFICGWRKDDSMYVRGWRKRR